MTSRNKRNDTNPLFQIAGGFGLVILYILAATLFYGGLLIALVVLVASFANGLNIMQLTVGAGLIVAIFAINAFVTKIVTKKWKVTWLDITLLVF